MVAKSTDLAAISFSPDQPSEHAYRRDDSDDDPSQEFLHLIGSAYTDSKLPMARSVIRCHTSHKRVSGRLVL
jgi:hypothetical protein